MLLTLRLRMLPQLLYTRLSTGTSAAAFCSGWRCWPVPACGALTKYAVLQGNSISRKTEQYWWPYTIPLQCLRALCIALVCREHCFGLICSTYFSGADWEGGRSLNFVAPDENQPVLVMLINMHLRRDTKYRCSTTPAYPAQTCSLLEVCV